MVTAHKMLTRDVGGCHSCSEPTEVVVVVRVGKTLTQETRLCVGCAKEAAAVIARGASLQNSKPGKVRR